MCNPLLISLIGAGVSYAAQQQANKTQQHVMDNMVARDKGMSNKTMDIIHKNLAQYAPAERAANLADVQTTTGNNLLDAVGRAHDTGQNIFGGTPGRVSDVYTDTQNKASDNTKRMGELYAGLMSKMQAPYTLRTNEAMNNADFAQQIGMSNDARKRIWQAGMTGLGRVQPNAGAMAAGAGLQSYGANMGG